MSMTGGTSSSGGTVPGALQIEIGVGDSITVGNLAVPAATNGYAGLLAANYGWLQRSTAVGGTNIGDWQQFQHQLFARTMANGVSVSIFGANDIRFTNNTAFDYTNFANAARAAVLYGTVAYSEQVKAGTWSFTGSWAAGSSGIPTYDLENMKQTSAVGAAGTVTTTGTTAYLVLLADVTGDVAFDVSIDGVSQGSFSDTGNQQSSQLELYHYYPIAFRFTGLSAGTHSLRVTYSSGTTNLILMWASGNTLTNHPRFFVGNCLPESPDTLAAQTALYNAALAPVLSQLFSDGLNAIAVNTHDAMDPSNASLWGDPVHPSNAGHAVLAATFEAAINSH